MPKPTHGHKKGHFGAKFEVPSLLFACIIRKVKNWKKAGYMV
ncbi:hypothetical protein HMPREF0083_05495 [Aneurinibacillus aneurinilyticus ATCC 12856]|uniref:Uncharacterized protein n=1 Tax=Aneurinibacillus aneurinilyticus ATCC 12856 TaxID=649747 RepID=U1WUK9_ANEAE|nr:hypothetical protein HMPREF0083_05495 [Aneurinibacillus aneurinilyticus ATCC 12856]